MVEEDMDTFVLVVTIVAVQEVMPMPLDGWKQFVADVEYTNERRGLRLVV